MIKNNPQASNTSPLPDTGKPPSVKNGSCKCAKYESVNNKPIRKISANESPNLLAFVWSDFVDKNPVTIAMKMMLSIPKTISIITKVNKSIQPCTVVNAEKNASILQM